MEISAATIYAGRLKSGVTEGGRAAPAGFDWPRTVVPVAIVEVGMAEGGRAGGEGKDGDSKFNTAEAKRIVDALVGVLGAGELKVLN